MRISLKKNKFCPHCHKVIRTNLFFKNKRQYDGFSTWCKECTNYSNKKRKEKNPERAREISKKSYEKNKSKISESNKIWASKNRDKRRITETKYRENNRDKRSYWESLRRARLNNLESDLPYNYFDILFETFGFKCMKPVCLKKISANNPLTVDHVIPVKMDGSSNKLDNLQLLCLSCNSSKGNRNSNDYRGVKCASV